LRPCLDKESKNSAHTRTIVTTALQRQYSQTELIFWISLVIVARDKWISLKLMEDQLHISHGMIPQIPLEYCGKRQICMQSVPHSLVDKLFQQIPGARSLGWLNFVHWHLIVMGPHYIMKPALPHVSGS